MEGIAQQTDKRRFKVSAVINAVRDTLSKLSARKIAIVIVPFMVLIAAFAVMLNLKHVTVIAAGRTTEITTFSTDPAEILKKDGITTSPYDKITFSGFQKNNGTIKVIPAFKVNVTADGKTTSVMIAEGTVSDVLKKSEVKVGKEDILSAALNSSVSANQTVTVKRVTYKTTSQVKPIAFKTVQETSTTLKKGVKKVLRQGAAGKKTVTTKVKCIDGKETDEKKVTETVTQEPVSCKMLVGTASSTPVSKLTPPSSLKLDSNGAPVNYKKYFTGKATGYTSGKGGYTASGRNAKVGYVAVNPKVIPYGTKLYIMSPSGSFVYGYAIAADTGDFVSNGSGILTDLYFASNSECRRFGSRTVNIYVLD